MRNDHHARIVEALPSGPSRIQLQPRSSEFEMVWFTSTPNAVDAVRHALQEPSPDQPREGGGRDAEVLCLTSGHQSPLALTELEQPLER